MNRIKDVLIEANRYSDVMKVLMDIPGKLKNIPNYPLRKPYVDDNGIYAYDLKPQEIIDQSIELIKCIDNGTSISDFRILYAYIEDESDVLLHNYAISVSHRNRSDVDMEYVRTLLIIGMICNEFYSDSDDIPFYIPDGWKPAPPVYVL